MSARSASAVALIERFRKRTSIVGIIGLGYVGLPLALRFSEVGFRVIGFDIDDAKAAAINSGRSYFIHIPSTAVASAKSHGFEATTDFSRTGEADALIICVPTPLNPSREPDLSFVINTTESVLPHLRSGQLISLESTTYPGTTEEELKPRLERRGFKVGEDVFLCFSPEREDPGNPHFTTRTIAKVCGGSTPSCLEVGLELYRQAVDTVVPVSSTQAAELTKLLENIHRAVNIGLVNEMKIIADRMGIDIHEVIRAAATKPFGFVPYFPGPGLGGHCIPIDPFYLTWKARQYGVHTRFIELAGEINSAMPSWVVSKVVDALNEQRKPVKGSRILVLGIAYKKNVDDMRESPSVELMELLIAKGARVDYSDPHVPAFPRMRKYHFDLTSVTINAENLAGYDLVLIATNHDVFDYEMIRRNSQLIVDTRGVYQVASNNIVRA
ncbi:MAG: nucleotide sugar dehydrogenase [Betaproteobacteria bacterium]|nr:nucleotide sugar dehydrogenase [Betaproteobacteria bacterium]